MGGGGRMRRTIAIASLVTSVLLVTSAGSLRAQVAHRTFAQPEEAVAALFAAVKAGKLEELLPLFGPEGQTLIDSSDPVTARKNRQVFAVAALEKWQLADDGPDRKILVIGYEDWPFPIPLVKVGTTWQFDTAAGKEEVLARRIGQNELSAIATSHAYVTAQRRYAERGHDGGAAGAYA